MMDKDYIGDYLKGAKEPVPASDFQRLEAARQVVNAARDLLDQIKVAKGANAVLLTSAQSMLVSAVSIMTGEYEVQS